MCSVQLHILQCPVKALSKIVIISVQHKGFACRLCDATVTISRSRNAKKVDNKDCINKVVILTCDPNLLISCVV